MGLVVGKTIDERFWNKVNKTEYCWLWTGAINHKGYGLFWSPNTKVAHRYSYENNIGIIPEGYQIDHLCKVRNCVRPDHLEAVTPKENNKRSGCWEVNKSKTHCPRGHEYTQENTYIQSKGGRVCKECSRILDRERYQKKKSLTNNQPSTTIVDT